MVWLIRLATHLSDAVILAVGAVSTAAIALVIAWMARRYWFHPRNEAIEVHAKLADIVHGGLLTFVVFVLALVLTDVRGNLSRADDAALREASIVGRLNRDLQSIGGDDAALAREHLKKYVAAVTGDEWRMLAQSAPALSPRAEIELTALVANVSKTANANPQIAAGLRGLIDKLEDLRQGRLESATKSVPPIFWWMIMSFLIGAMIMNGRYALNWESGTLIVLHMAAIGLVIALIVAMDEPFRGETSISAVPIAKAAGL